jgi:hypothetical protein
MTETSAVSLFPVCRRCGSRYRPSQWGREYACAACGARLTETAAAGPGRRVTLPRIRLTPLVLGALVSAGAAGGWYWYARSAAEARAREPAARVELPAGFRAHLDEKIARLRADLPLAPRSPLLLRSLAVAHTQRYVLLRDTDPRESLTDLRDARSLAAELRLVDMEFGSQLLTAFARPETFRWLVSRDEAPDPQRARRLVLGGEGGPRPRLAGPTAAVTGRPLTAMDDSPGQPAVTSAAPAGAMGGRLTTERDSWRPRDLEEFDRKAAEQLSKRPIDLQVLLLLAGWIQEEAQLQGVLQVQPTSQADAMEAARAARQRCIDRGVRMLEGAAAATQVHAFRAVLYGRAAAFHELQSDYEREYATLKRALTEAPYSAVLWRRLLQCCRRTNRDTEAREAKKNAEDWLFPAVEVSPS